MSREIKFRAWATQANKMIDLKAITPLALSDGMLDEGDGLFIPFRDDIVLMQYTGLKDKNGVEIYEGDIIQEQGTNFQILFGEYETSEATCIGFYYNDGHPFGRAYSNREMGEVIGNIHQNPELL